VTKGAILAILSFEFLSLTSLADPTPMARGMQKRICSTVTELKLLVMPSRFRIEEMLSKEFPNLIPTEIDEAYDFATICREEKWCHSVFTEEELSTPIKTTRALLKINQLAHDHKLPEWTTPQRLEWIIEASSHDSNYNQIFQHALGNHPPYVEAYLKAKHPTVDITKLITVLQKCAQDSDCRARLELDSVSSKLDITEQLYQWTESLFNQEGKIDPSKLKLKLKSKGLLKMLLIYGEEHPERLSEIREKIVDTKPYIVQVLTKEFPDLSEKYLNNLHKVAENCEPESLCGTIFLKSKTSSTLDLTRQLVLVDEMISDRKVSGWIKDQDHLKWVLNRNESLGNQTLLHDLRKNTHWLDHVYSPKTSPNSVLTYSLEKEGAGPEVTEFYRPPYFTDEKWFQETPQKRLGYLWLCDPKLVKATSKKPHFLGQFTQEVTQLRNSKSMNAAYEIKHDTYEIDYGEFEKQLDFIGTNLGYQELHLNKVMELPTLYPQAHFDNMIDWVKHENDYLFFKGMEEGLHPTWLTGAASFQPLGKKDLSKTRKQIFDRKVSRLPQRLSDIDDNDYKFMAFAVRQSSTYGITKNQDMTKLAFELREFSRKPQVLKSISRETDVSLKDEVWMRRELKSRGKEFTFDEREETAIQLASKYGLNQKLIRRFHDKHYFVAVPLQDFENGQYFDYRSGKWFKPTDFQKKKIVQARNYYIQEMNHLQRNFKEMIKKGESESLDYLEQAMKMTLTEWSRMSGVSELYRYY